MPRTLAGVAHEVHGRLIGPDAGFGPVTIDSRRTARGGLFVAICGEHADGNDFVADARARGAAGALVSRHTELLPNVEVDDTRVALGRMAKAWRANFEIPAVAVTGSNGKTTVKELVASILRIRRDVCVTEGNLNNELGVPLTLMRLGPEHAALVVEMGANHGGEIAYLSELAQPTVGVITNANPAHLEGFDSLAGVAAAKGELLDYLPRAGAAVINADDPFRTEWAGRARSASVLTFGFAAGADCSVDGDVEYTQQGARFLLRLPSGQRAAIELPLPGERNVVNALAAAAAAEAVGASPEDIGAGLATARPVTGRLNVLPGRGGAVIVDDSYNANPASARAALDYLARLPGRRVLVLGEMAELGQNAARLHREVGEYARGRCDLLVAVGSPAAEAGRAFGAGGCCVDSVEAAENALTPLLAAGVTVLVKASRRMRLEQLVRALAAPEGAGAAPC